jgi:GAF domain-containing protein
MPLPSLYASSDPARAWSVTHCACYGALLGALAALFRTLGPFRPAHANLAGSLAEIAAAALAFALLCAGAALLRNFIARRLIWQEHR